MNAACLVFSPYGSPALQHWYNVIVPMFEPDHMAIPIGMDEESWGDVPYTSGSCSLEPRILAVRSRPFTIFGFRSSTSDECSPRLNTLICQHHKLPDDGLSGLTPPPFGPPGPFRPRDPPRRFSFESRKRAS